MKSDSKTRFARAGELIGLLAAGFLASSCGSMPHSAGARRVFDFSAVTQGVQGWVDRGYYPGAAVMVAQDNQVIYEKCFGNYTPDTVDQPFPYTS